MLNREQTKAFYDRFGSRQDSQAFYEDSATRDLIAHAEFGRARVVFEFGCGTGRFAEKLLESYLPSQAVFHGVDISETMVQLSAQRLARFGDRVRISLSDGSAKIDADDRSVDRIVSNYVLDLLPNEMIGSFLTEAHRALSPEGRLCLVSLTHGRAILTKLVAWGWNLLYSIRPTLVGGCRPIELQDFLGRSDWGVEYQNAVAAFGITSEIVVASVRQE